jgi:hypothetical protein
MRRTPLLGAAALSLVLGAAACGGDDGDSEAELKEQLTGMLERGGRIAPEAADCYADIVVEEIGVERLQDVDLSAAVPDELADEIAAATIQADEECELPDG